MARKLVVSIVGDSESLQRSFQRSSTSARGFERDMTHATRGVLAGSGALRSLGRSLAFASAGFVGFASAATVIRRSVEAASEAGVTQRQLATQFRAAGLSLGDYRKQIDQTSSSLSALSGFTADELTASFTQAFRGTRNVSDALKIEAVAADVARGRHIGLAQAQLALTKAAEGQNTALKRLGIILPANVKGMDAVAVAGERFAGQARAGATAQERLSAVLHNSEVIIGTALLPTLTRLADHLAVYLTKLNESGKLQRDVNVVVHDAGVVFHVAADAAKVIAGALKVLSHAAGGSENAIKGLAGAFLLLKAGSLLGGFGAISAGLTGVGASATGAAGGVTLLASRLRLLAVGALFAAEIAGLEKLKQKILGLQDAADSAASRTAAIGSGVRRTLLPKLAAEINSLKGQGLDSATILKRLRAQLGGSSLADAIIADAFHLSRGASDAASKKLRDEIAGAAVKAVQGAAAIVKKHPLSLQGQFNLLDLSLAKAGLTAGKQDDRALLAQEAAIVKQQAEHEKILTKRTALYQQLAQIDAQIASIDADAASKRKAAAEKQAAARKASQEHLLAVLELGVERAGLTKGLGDDLKALDAQAAALKRLIASDKGNLDLQRQLVGVEQARASVQAQQRDAVKAQRQAAAAALEARQFAVLGLGPTGQELVPTVKQLRADLAKAVGAIALDQVDAETRKQLAEIRKLLSGRLGKLAEEVRARIAQMLGAIQDSLKTTGSSAALSSGVQFATGFPTWPINPTSPAQAIFSDSPTTAASSSGTSGTQVTYAPTIVSPDLQGAAQAQQADWFRFRQQL